MPRRNRAGLTAKELRTLRIVVTQAGPGANGRPRVMLDVTAQELAQLARYSGGVKDYDFEDGDTGSYVRIAVSLPPRKPPF